MKYFLIFTVLSLLIGCDENFELNQSKEKTGLGIIYLDPKSPIRLFKNEFDTIAFDSIIFKKNKVFKKGSFTIETNLKSKIFKPFGLYEGDSEKDAIENINSGLIKFEPLISFKVLEHKNHLYKILLNDFTKEYCYINIENRLDLQSKDYLKKINFDPNLVPDTINNWFYYENWLQHFRHSHFFANNNLKFFNEPKVGKEVEIKDKNILVDTLIGEWAKCYIDENKFVWTKWKKNDSILFEYSRFLYY